MIRGATGPMALLIRDLLFLLLKITTIALLFILLFSLVFGIVRCEEHSMAPAVKDGDLVLFFRHGKSGYQSGDAIVVEVEGRQQVRRISAQTGDIVDITEDGLIINGDLQQEPGITERTERYREGVGFPLTVPEGMVFVLGDNRTRAYDSRLYGCVRIEETLGKVMTVIRRRSI